MRLATLAFTMLLFFPGVAPAGDGWTWDSPYWYYNGQAYSEKSYSEPYTYSYYDAYGCLRYATAYRNKTYYAKAYPVQAAYQQSGFDAAIGVVGAIAKSRNVTENTIRKQAAEVALIGEALKAYGMYGNFGYQDFGLNSFRGTYMRDNILNPVVSLGSYGQQGGTVVGNSTSTYTKSTNAFGLKMMDLDAADVTSARLVQGGLDYANGANNGRLQIVKEVGAQQGRLAEIAFRADAGAKLFRSTEPQAQSSSTTTVTQTNPVLIQPGSVSPTVGASVSSAQRVDPSAALSLDDLQRWQALPGPASCFSCHGDGKERQKAFDITRYHPRVATKEQKQAVVRYFSGQTKCTGEKLPADQILQLMQE